MFGAKSTVDFLFFLAYGHNDSYPFVLCILLILGLFGNENKIMAHAIEIGYIRILRKRAISNSVVHY